MPLKKKTVNRALERARDAYLLFVVVPAQIAGEIYKAIRNKVKHDM